MNETLDRLISLLFPKRCILCDEVVAYHELLCAHCQPDQMDGILCPQCGKQEGHCVCRSDHTWRFSRAVNALHYRGTAREALLRLKQDPEPRALAFFAAQCEDALSAILPGFPFDLVAEVPMHPAKRKKRGFNQAELLAETLADRLGLPHGKEMLTCGGESIVQHSLSREDRFASVKGRYQLAGQPQGLRILLVDDIMTTGATLDACADCLIQGGAAQVIALAVAGTDRVAGTPAT